MSDLAIKADRAPDKPETPHVEPRKRWYDALFAFLRKRWFEILLAALGVFFTAVFATVDMLYREQIRDWLNRHSPFLATLYSTAWTAARFAVFTTLLAAVVWKWRAHIIAKKALSAEIERCNALAQRNAEVETQLNAANKAKEKIANRRWETITRINYGPIEYEPFLRYTVTDPTGFGVYLLNKMIRPTNGPKDIDFRPKDRRHWNDVFDGLNRGDYDVIATPLFATFERSTKVRFTAPLFYSNIGFYVSSGTAAQPQWNGANASALGRVNTN